MRLRKLFRYVAGLALTCLMHAGVQAQEIVLGQIGPFTGIPVPDAQEIRQGIAAYVNQVNNAGGIHGRKLAFFQVDDHYSADGFAEAFRTAMERKPVALISPVGSAALSRMLKDGLLDDAEVVVVNAVPGAEVLRNPGHPKLFHVRAGDRQQVGKIVTHTRTLGMTRLAVLYQDLPVGTSAMADMQQQVGLVPGQTVTGVKSATDPAQLAAAAAEVARLDAQAVVVLGAPRFMAEGIAALRKAGVARAIFVRSDVPAQLIVKLAGAEGARGVGIAQNFPDPNGLRQPLVREFKAAMKSAHPDLAEYTPFQLEGYVSARLVGEALKRTTGEPTAARLQKVLHGLNDFDLGGLRVDFSNGQVGSRWVDIAVIGADGKLHY